MLMEQLGDIDQLENLLRGATNPGALAEVDIDKARDLLGDESARSLERLAELAKMLEEAGLIENKEGRFELTPRGIRKIGQNALVRPLRQARQGQDGQPRARAQRRRPRARVRDQALRVRRSVQPRHRAHGAQRDPAHGWRHARAPLARRLRGRAHRDPRAIEHRAHARPLAVDADARQLPRGEEGRDGVALADLEPVPARLPRHRRVLRDRTRAEARAAARGLVGLRLRHEHAARVPAQPAHARPPVGHEADHHDHRRRADRPPRCPMARCSSTTRPCRRPSTPP